MLKSLKRIVRRTLMGVLCPIRFAIWRTREVSKPRRILILNGNHLGDIVISTGLLPVLHSAFPGVQIGYVCGSWAMPVLRSHPLVTYRHTIDLPDRNRAALSRLARWKLYRRQRAQALREIRQVGYDWAIALPLWRPDFLDIACLARIPVRVAYKRHLMSLLATHLTESSEGKLLIPEGACQIELLRTLGVGESHFGLRRATLAADSAAAIDELKNLFSAQASEVPAFFLVHIGAGTTGKEMPNSFWREFAEELSRSSIVLFTGRGAREKENIGEVIEGLPRCISAADRLSWDGLVAAVRRARVVFSVDTATCHVAGAVNTPLIAVHSGIGSPGHWRAEGERVTVWTNAVPCSPCARPSGCSKMTCLQGIRPRDLLNSLNAYTAIQGLVQVTSNRENPIQPPSHR